MKAVRWYGPKDMRFEDVPAPDAPKEGFIKVKVKWCGICGSDLHEYIMGPISIPVAKEHPVTGKKAPLILGHEFSGEVVEVGKGVTNVVKGDRITVNPFIGCGTCYMCRANRQLSCENVSLYGLMDDGAFAEYINVPADHIVKLPEGMSYELGALIEPMAVAVHAVRTGNVLVGQTVAVMGGGPIGLCNVLVAKAAGAAQVISVEPAKLRMEYAEKCGATTVLDPKKADVVEEIKKLTGGRGVDVAIDCAGLPQTIPAAVNATKRGGRTVIVGISEAPTPFNFNDILYSERNIYGIHGYTGYFSEFEPAVALIAGGTIKPELLITGKIKLKDLVEKGFKELIEHKEKNLKIIVTPE